MCIRILVISLQFFFSLFGTSHEFMKQKLSIDKLYGHFTLFFLFSVQLKIYDGSSKCTFVVVFFIFVHFLLVFLWIQIRVQIQILVRFQILSRLLRCIKMKFTQQRTSPIQQKTSVHINLILFLWWVKIQTVLNLNKRLQWKS